MPFYIASYEDDLSLHKPSNAIPVVTPLMCIITGSKNCVEQIYLSVGKISDSVNVPLIVWHIRKLNTQFFAHFYISKECLPLSNVWIKYFCMAESEQISDMITNKQESVQSILQKRFNAAAKKLNFETVEAFMESVWSKHKAHLGKYLCSN